MCSRMWDIPARAKVSVVLPALTHACTATTGDDGFGRITTVSPLPSTYFSTNGSSPAEGVAPPAIMANRAAPSAASSQRVRFLFFILRSPEISCALKTLLMDDPEG